MELDNNPQTNEGKLSLFTAVISKLGELIELVSTAPEAVTLCQELSEMKHEIEEEFKEFEKLTEDQLQ